MAATPQESTRPTCATTHTPTASTGSAASKVECVLTATSDGKWTRDCDVFAVYRACAAGQIRRMVVWCAVVGVSVVSVPVTGFIVDVGSK